MIDNNLLDKKNFSKDKTLIIIEHLSDGLMVFDEEKKVFLINPAINSLFNLNENILGLKIDDFVNYPDLKELFFLLGNEMREFFRKELEIRKDLVLEITSLYIPKLGYLVILHDITREKAIERMKTEFVSLSAHQLRTPLSALNWTLDTLLKEKFGKLTEEQRKIVFQAQETNKRMLALVNDLLDVVKIEEGNYLGRLTPVNLEKIVQIIIKDYEEEIKRRQIKLELQFPSGNLPKVKADREKISSAIQNLIDNAIRYNIPGGMIVISLDFDKKDIKFSITDSGIGIPEREKQQIFNKFFRASNATKVETEGNGLGLFVSKNIIEAHGGRIWFESKQGEGSTFYFVLPFK